MKIVTVVGARPQYIKAAPLSRAFSDSGIEEVLIDTGQHYDPSMAAVFFSELGLPKPYRSLSVGSGSHGQMTARILERVEKALVEISPDAVVVFGDTNSTLAGALAAAKLAFPVVHVEAGLRSFRTSMPEEINRKVSDHLSSVLLCPNGMAVRNLKNEGVAGKDAAEELISLEGPDISQCRQFPFVCNVGDIMVDSLFAIRDQQINVDLVNKIGTDNYALVTLHRAESTDDSRIFRGLIEAVADLSKYTKVIFPIHPRTRKKIFEEGLDVLLMSEDIHCLDPLSYGEFVTLQANAKVIITDSGGVQKEAYLLDRPCLTLRDETEWGETVESGWNHLLGRCPQKFVTNVLETKVPAGVKKDIFGDGRAAKRIVNCISAMF